MGSVSKLWAPPSFCSQTMSRWPCRHTLGARSCPRDAGFFTRTLPALSCFAESRSRLAACMTYFAMAASFFEPRGIAEISEKYFQTSGGVRSSVAWGMSVSFGGENAHPNGRAEIQRTSIVTRLSSTGGRQPFGPHAM